MKIRVRRIDKYREIDLDEGNLCYTSGVLNEGECLDRGKEFLEAGLILLENVKIEKKLYESLEKAINKILE